MINLQNRMNIEKNNNIHQMYILKNYEQRQEGLKLIDSWSEVMDPINMKKFYIIQEYLYNPYIINKRKVNFRVYYLVVCSQNNYSCYIYNNGFMYYTPEFYDPNKKWLPRPWQDFCQAKGVNPVHISRIENIITRQGIENIVNLVDLNWWFQMYVTYQYWTVRSWTFNLENISTNNNLGFFDCDIMNQWSLANRSILSQHLTQKDYKQCYRDEIAKFWPNTDYVANKPKIKSRQGFAWAKIKMLKHNQDFLFLYWQDGQIKSYGPAHYPIFNREKILEDLASMQ
jgi:hypothetical protein